MRREFMVGSVLLPVVLILLWIIASASSVIGAGFTSVFFGTGLMVYGASFNPKKSKIIDTLIFAWADIASYFGVIFAQKRRFSFIHVSAPGIDHYVTSLNYYALGIVPVILLFGLLFALEALLTPATVTVIKPKETIVSTEKRCSVCHEPSIYEVCMECEKTYQKEIQRVRSQIWRAKKAGEPATLTIAEWLQTIANFNSLCAYCQKDPINALNTIYQ